jgi:hypothetical protein
MEYWNDGMLEYWNDERRTRRLRKKLLNCYRVIWLKDLE